MKTLRCCLGLVLLSLAACETTDGARPVPVVRPVTFTGDYFRGPGLTRKPAMLKSVPPRYPMQFRSPGNHGEAKVEFLINTEGVPEQVQYSSATDAAFGEAACAAVRQWRYRPAEMEGRPVSIRSVQLVTFDTGANR